MKNKYLLSVMLTSMEEAAIPKTNSFETEALMKPEDNMAVCFCYAVWDYSYARHLIDSEELIGSGSVHLVLTRDNTFLDLANLTLRRRFLCQQSWRSMP